MTTTIYRTKDFKGTWCGGEAISWNYQTRKSRTVGKRVVVMRWTGGKTEVRAVEGDGRGPDFKVHEALQLPGDATEDCVRGVALNMGVDHFGWVVEGIND